METYMFDFGHIVGVAQLVEHNTHKVKVTGSIPVVDTYDKSPVRGFYHMCRRSTVWETVLQGSNGFLMLEKSDFSPTRQNECNYLAYPAVSLEILYAGISMEMATYGSVWCTKKGKLPSEQSGLLLRVGHMNTLNHCMRHSR